MFDKTTMMCNILYMDEQGDASNSRVALDREASTPIVGGTRVSIDHSPISTEYPLTPEDATRTFQRLWEVRRVGFPSEPIGSISARIEVSQCPYTAEELVAFEKAGRKVSFLPSEFSNSTKAQELLKALGKHEWINGLGYIGNTEEDRGGWFDYDASVDASNSNITGEEFERRLEDMKRQGMNLNQYIVASFDNKHFTNEFLDQGEAHTMLLRSVSKHDERTLVAASFKPHGILNFMVAGRNERSPTVFARSVGVKAA